MPAGGLVSAGIGAVIGGGQAIYGASQKKKYQRQMDALAANMPQYQINQEEQNMQSLAEGRANQGMGAGAKQQLQNNADRTLATLSNSALMGGANANAIGGLVDKSQAAYNQNAMYDDQIRLQNLQNLTSNYARMSANKDKQWSINQYQPWKNKMTGLAGQLQGANTMMQSGINMAGSSLMSAGGKMGGMGGGLSNSAQGMSSLDPASMSMMPASPGGPQQMQEVPIPSSGMNYPGAEYPTNHQALYEPGTTNYWGQYGIE